jgi:hypothetical protein
MMCRFDSFAVPLTQQSKSSEFMGKNSVFGIYQGNIPGPRIRARCGHSAGVPAIRAAKAAAWERRCMPSLASREDT